MGVIKENGRGGWWNPMTFYFVHFLNIWQEICFKLPMYMKTSFPYMGGGLFCQKSCENPMFLRFLAKNRFLLIFMYIFNASKFLRARWLYDLTVTSYEVQWYSFWNHWTEEVHTYTLVANIGISGVPYRKSREGLKPPLRMTCYKKYPRRIRDINMINRPFFAKNQRIVRFWWFKFIAVFLYKK